MKRLSIILLAALLVGLLLTAYIGRNAGVVRINQEDAGKTIELSTGDKLEVSLEGNPSTGYTWEVVSGDDLLEQGSEPEFSAGSQAVVGASGVVRLTFDAPAAGWTRLELAYLRPFERDVEPAETFFVDVVVK